MFIQIQYSQEAYTCFLLFFSGNNISHTQYIARWLLNFSLICQQGVLFLQGLQAMINYDEL